MSTPGCLVIVGTKLASLGIIRMGRVDGFPNISIRHPLQLWWDLTQVAIRIVILGFVCIGYPSVTLRPDVYLCAIGVGFQFEGVLYHKFYKIW